MINVDGTMLVTDLLAESVSSLTLNAAEAGTHAQRSAKSVEATESASWLSDLINPS